MAIVNQADLAELRNISLPTVRAWVRRGCPYKQKGARGKEWLFNTADVFEWREEQAALNAIGDTSSLDIDEAKRRKMAAEAALCELELSKARGDVVSLAEVGAVWLDIVSSARSRMLSIPAKMAAIIAPESDPMAIRALLEAELEESLDELSRFEQGDVTGGESSAESAD